MVALCPAAVLVSPGRAGSPSNTNERRQIIFEGPSLDLLLLLVKRKEKRTLKLEVASSEYHRRIGNSITGLRHRILLPESFGKEGTWQAIMQVASLTFDWLEQGNKVYEPIGGAEHASAADTTRWQQTRPMKIGTQVWGRASALTETDISHDH